MTKPRQSPNEQNPSQQNMDMLEDQIWQDPALLAALSEFSDATDTSTDIPNESTGVPTDNKQQNRKNKKHISQTWFAMAASIAIFSVVWFGYQPTQDPLATEIPLLSHVSKTTSKSVALPDGSKIALNRHSHVDYQATTDKRLVTLEQGEVYFDVARDIKRPFEISSRDMTITVLGTAFNVDVYKDGSQLQVYHGKVHVLNRYTHETTILTKGQGLELTGNGEFIKVTFEDLQPQWQQGWLQFSKTPLKQAIDKLNRYSNKSILLGPGLTNMSISGRFKINEVEQSLALIAGMHHLRVSEFDTSIVLELSDPG